MFFLTADEVFLTVAVTGVLFLVSSWVFSSLRGLSEARWRKVGATLFQPGHPDQRIKLRFWSAVAAGVAPCHRASAGAEREILKACAHPEFSVHFRRISYASDFSIHCDCDGGRGRPFGGTGPNQIDPKMLQCINM